MSHLSIYPSIYVSIHLSIYLSIHPSIYLSICLSIYPSIHPSIHIFLHSYSSSHFPGRSGGWGRLRPLPMVATSGGRGWLHDDVPWNDRPSVRAQHQLPSGKPTKNHGKSPFFMCKSTNWMAIFNSKLLVYQAGYMGLMGSNGDISWNIPPATSHNQPWVVSWLQTNPTGWIVAIPAKSWALFDLRWVYYGLHVVDLTILLRLAVDQQSANCRDLSIGQVPQCIEMRDIMHNPRWVPQNGLKTMQNQFCWRLLVLGLWTIVNCLRSWFGIGGWVSFCNIQTDSLHFGIILVAKESWCFMLRWALEIWRQKCTSRSSRGSPQSGLWGSSDIRRLSWSRHTSRCWLKLGRCDPAFGIVDGPPLF